jgi:hypothetical protein
MLSTQHWNVWNFSFKKNILINGGNHTPHKSASSKDNYKATTKALLEKSIKNLNILDDICRKSWRGDRRVMVSLYHGVNSSKTYNVNFMYHSATKLNLSQTLSTALGFIFATDEFSTRIREIFSLY